MMTKIIDWFVVFVASAIMVFASVAAKAQETRLKDLVNIRGVRTNQIIGVGLIIGLNKSGDSAKSISTNRLASGLMTKLGSKVTEQEIASGSSAIVLVTAEMPAFSRNGDRIDSRVAILGDAKSLSGGVLVSTPLKGGDGNVYGFASGPVVIGQANGAGTQVQTVAVAPGSVVIEREFAPDIEGDGRITLSLKNPDFTTNNRIVAAVNKHMRGFYAKSVDVHGIDIDIPPHYDGKTVEFISELENVKVVADQKSVVVINERTGTVVMGGDVIVAPVTISHGDLSISVGSGKGGGGKDKGGKTVVNMGGSTVSKLIESMNAMGMKPADLVGVMQAIQAAGALQADLKFM
ncbi:MAG: flagellar basal body P-ring protein FlgI [Proteobacteria bacterium]|nr:flagellar basal body P-ring protein FlgI [Pseudomonadota bacterium]